MLASLGAYPLGLREFSFHSFLFFQRNCSPHHTQVKCRKPATSNQSAGNDRFRHHFFLNHISQQPTDLNSDNQATTI